MTHFLDHAQVVSFLSSYGYWAVFVIVALESAGVPLPGETILVGSAIYAGESHNMRVEGIVAAGAAGAIFGDNVGFWLGREFGSRLIERYGKTIGLDARKQKLGQYLFMRWGGAIVVVGRFVALLRALAAILAGVNRMDPLRFFTFNAAGSIIWASAFGVGGYLFGASIHRIAGPIGWLALACAVIGGFIFWRYFKSQEERLLRDAEAAITEDAGQR